MNILLSAYACEPNKGSEPGVGWSLAIEIAKHHKVWVVTRDNNKDIIENYLDKHPEYKNDNLNFIYVGISPKISFWKKGRRGMRLFYMLWQKKAIKVVKKIHKKNKFDLVQHVTFVSYTQVTYMYKLGIPMIWGPISGGENIHKSIKVDMNLKERLIEIIRKLSQSIAPIIPCIRKTMKKSKYILVATDETKEKIPQKYQDKTIVMPAICIQKMPIIKTNKNKDDKIRIIMAGRLIYWKSFDIGIKSFLKIVDKYPNTELHILGEGNKKQQLESLVGKYLNDRIFFQEQISHDEIYDYYQKFDIFMNTTLRDSGCMTMMEAMSVGLPCICINTGGPKLLSENMEFSKVEPDITNNMIDEISSKLERLILDDLFRNKLSNLSRQECGKFTVHEKIKLLDEIYLKIK